MSTEISWTDETWNPTTGCDRVSAGCDNCYALTMAARLKAMGQAKYQRDGDPRTSGPGFGLTMHSDALDLPLRWRKPRRVFVNSMSDLFHDEVSDDFVRSVFDVMGQSPLHTFQVLTKRPRRMRVLVTQIVAEYAGKFDACPTEEMRDSPAARWASERALHGDPNVWLGVSVEDERYANIRIPHLIATPASVRFLSMEPLLGPVNMLPWLRRISDEARAASEYEWTRDRIDWVIIGGESGRNARPMEIEWAQDIVDVCRQYDVPVFVKQLGTVAGGKQHHDIDTFPESLRVREFPA